MCVLDALCPKSAIRPKQRIFVTILPMSILLFLVLLPTVHAFIVETVSYSPLHNRPWWRCPSMQRLLLHAWGNSMQGACTWTLTSTLLLSASLAPLVLLSFVVDLLAFCAGLQRQCALSDYLYQYHTWSNKLWSRICTDCPKPKQMPPQKWLWLDRTGSPLPNYLLGWRNWMQSWKCHQSITCILIIFVIEETGLDVGE